MKRKTSEDWKRIIQDQQASGLTAAEFCRQNNINQKYFSHKKLKFTSQQSPFISAKKPKASTDVILLSWNEMHLEFNPQTEPETIASLMKALNS